MKRHRDVINTIYQSIVAADAQSDCICTMAVHFGKHERTLLAFSVLPMSLIPFSATLIIQGVLLGDALLASRCLLVIPVQTSQVGSCHNVTFLTRSTLDAILLYSSCQLVCTMLPSLRETFMNWLYHYVPTELCGNKDDTSCQCLCWQSCARPPCVSTASDPGSTMPTCHASPLLHPLLLS